MIARTAEKTGRVIVLLRRFSRGLGLSTSCNVYGRRANIAVVGTAQYPQEWYLPNLKNHDLVDICAIVDDSSPEGHPSKHLQEQYHTRIFSSTAQLLNDPIIGPNIDGIVIASSPKNRFLIARDIIKQGVHRRKELLDEIRPIHVFVQPPLTDNYKDALQLADLFHKYQNMGGKGLFLLDYPANYSTTTQTSAELVQSEIGRVRNIMAHMIAAKGSAIHNDTTLSHLLAWIYSVSQQRPLQVHCRMNQVAFGAIIEMKNGTLWNLSGVTVLPAKNGMQQILNVRIDIAGSKGILHYEESQLNPVSGRLELRHLHSEDDQQYTSLFPCGQNLEILFGIERELSIEQFILACLGKKFYMGADIDTEVLIMETLEALHSSAESHTLRSLD